MDVSRPLSVDLGIDLNKTGMISTLANEALMVAYDVPFGARSGGYTQTKILIKRNYIRLNEA